MIIKVESRGRVKYKSFFLQLEDKSCYILGGNKGAANIAKSLLDENALLTVWSQNFVSEFNDLIKLYPNRLNLLQAEFTEEVAEHYTSAKIKPFIVITAFLDQDQNDRIAKICHNNHVMCYNPNSDQSEVLIHDNNTIEPIEIALNIKGMPTLTRLFQNKISKMIEQNWLPAILAYQDFQNSEFMNTVGDAEKRIILRRLAEEIVKNDGDFNLAETETKLYYNDLLEKDELLLELADERSQMD